MKKTEAPAMKIKNVQTNNIFTLTDREQIGQCLKQTFNSQVACERFVDGQKRDDFITRAIPRFQILSCDKELGDLIPKEEATLSIREQLIGKSASEVETIEDLKRFCYEKGIHHSPSVSYSKLLEKVNQWKVLNSEPEQKKPRAKKELKEPEQ